MIVVYALAFIVAGGAYAGLFWLRRRVRAAVSVGVFLILSVAATLIVVAAGDPPLPGARPAVLSP